MRNCSAVEVLFLFSQDSVLADFCIADIMASVGMFTPWGHVYVKKGQVIESKPGAKHARAAEVASDRSARPNGEASFGVRRHPRIMHRSHRNNRSDCGLASRFRQR